MLRYYPLLAPVKEVQRAARRRHVASEISGWLAFLLESLRSCLRSVPRIRVKRARLSRFPDSLRDRSAIIHELFRNQADESDSRRKPWTLREGMSSHR